VRQNELSATVTHVVIRVGALAVLAFWCFRILQPFIIPVIWGIIIAVAIYPLYQMLVGFLRGRRTLAATLVTVVLLAVLLVPTIMLTTLLVENAASLAQKIYQEHIVIPPPPASVKDWPLIGKPITDIWNLAAHNLADALKLIQPQLKAVGTWMLGMATSGGLGLIMFVFAFGIAGILLRYSEEASKVAHDLSGRLAGARGDEFAKLTGATIRSVPVCSACHHSDPAGGAGIHGGRLARCGNLGLFVPDRRHGADRRGSHCHSCGHLCIHDRGYRNRGHFSDLECPGPGAR
jgi:predicted PurR-regulated permease PerM